MKGLREDSAKFDATNDAKRNSQLTGTPFEGFQRFRSFGHFGPRYEVLSINGDWLRIYLFNSSEEADYRFDHAIDDPIVN